MTQSTTITNKATGVATTPIAAALPAVEEFVHPNELCSSQTTTMVREMLQAMNRVTGSSK